MKPTIASLEMNKSMLVQRLFINWVTERRSLGGFPRSLVVELSMSIEITEVIYEIL